MTRAMRKQYKGWLIAVVIVLAGAALGYFSGLITHTVRVQKQMTWEVAPEEYNPAYYAKPDEYVRFRYVENPQCVDVESAKNLGAELRSSGKKVVNVEFEVWGGFRGVHGYRILAVDGRPLVNVGGWGSNGAENYSGPCPISKAMRY